MKEVTFKGKLVAKQEDYAGYITYVFENLESEEIESQYIMCTQFPSWEQNVISIGDIGFTSVRFVISGKDTWYDSFTNTYTPYKNTDTHFIKFVPVKQNNESLDIKIT